MLASICNKEQEEIICMIYFIQECGCFCERLQGQRGYPKPCKHYPGRNRIGEKKSFFVYVCFYFCVF